MIEFANHPAFLPTLGGFLAGAVLCSVIGGIRIRLARSAVRAEERVAEEKISNLKSEKSALETEIATLRSSEARFIKHQGELEALAKSDEERAKELTRLLETTRENLESEIKASEQTLLKAVKALEVLASPPPAQDDLEPFAPPTDPADSPEAAPTAEEDLDFVPMENVPPSPGQPEAFEGFAEDQTAAKAESAANAFRAALKENK